MGEPQYRYHMVQIPPRLLLKESKGDDAARYMEKVVNGMASKGWEFWRVDSIGVDVEPGCVGFLLGRQRSRATYHVVTFRRPAEQT